MDMLSVYRRHFIHKPHAVAALILCIVLFVFWMLIVSPWIKKIPSNFSYSADIISVDNFYDEANEKYLGEQYSITTYSYDAVSSSRNAEQIRHVFDVRTPKGDPIFSTTRYYNVNRWTGAHIPQSGDESREGYLFAPRNLKKGEPFTYWHINYDGPAHMSYEGEEVIHGVHVYRYSTKYEGIHIDQTKSLTHLPGVGKKRGVVLEPFLQIWVEPVTGLLINYRDETTAYYYDLSTGQKIAPWNHFSNTFREESILLHAQRASQQRSMFFLIDTIIPSLMMLVILVLSIHIFWSSGPMMLGRVYSFLATYTAHMTILFGMASLMVWWIAGDNIASWLPSFFIVNPMTAMLFLLLGLGRIIFSFQRKTIAIVLPLVMMSICLERMSNVLNLTSFSIDQSLFSQTLVHLGYAYRMSSFSAVSFFLLALLFLSYYSKRLSGSLFPLLIVFVVCLQSIFSLVGYSVFHLDATTWLIGFSGTTFASLLMGVNTISIFYLIWKQYEFSSSTFISPLLLVIVSCGVLVTLYLANSYEELVVRSGRDTFSLITSNLQADIEERMRIYENMLKGGRGMFYSSHEVTRSEWNSYVKSLEIEKNYLGVQGVGVSVFVSAQEKNRHIASVRGEGFPDYDIRPLGVRDVYSSIIYLEPFTGRNLSAFGYDMYSNPIRRKAMEEARDTGEVRLSGKVRLVQENGKDEQAGFLLYVPMYKTASEAGTLEERRKSILGYVYSPFRAHDLFQQSVYSVSNDIGFAVYDGVESLPEDLLYEKSLRTTSPANTEKEYTKTSVSIIAGHPWTMKFHAQISSFKSATDTAISLFFIVTGLTVSTLLSLLISSLISSRARAVEYADHVTSDLQTQRQQLLATNDSLNHEIEQRKKTEHILLEKTNQLERTNQLMVDRELRMIELKKRITELETS